MLLLYLIAAGTAVYRCFCNSLNPGEILCLSDYCHYVGAVNYGAFASIKSDEIGQVAGSGNAELDWCDTVCFSRYSQRATGGAAGGNCKRFPFVFLDGNYCCGGVGDYW